MEDKKKRNSPVVQEIKKEFTERSSRLIKSLQKILLKWIMLIYGIILNINLIPGASKSLIR